MSLAVGRPPHAIVMKEREEGSRQAGISHFMMAYLDFILRMDLVGEVVEWNGSFIELQ